MTDWQEQNENEQRDILSIYGSVSFGKRYCPKCKRHAFVIDGILQCCERRVSEIDRNDVIVKVESPGGMKRRHLTMKKKIVILKSQRWKCIYCECELTEDSARFDHFVPFHFLQTNPVSNFVAACEICNTLKADMMFENINDASKYLKKKRNDKGIQ